MRRDRHAQINQRLNVYSETGFNLSPFGDAIFVFCNRKRDRLKILHMGNASKAVGDGFWLYFKRLEKGHFRRTALNARRVTKWSGFA